MSSLIGLAAIAIVAWFAAGTVWNVRAGRSLIRWMQQGLPLLGARTTLRWLGSSVVEMLLNDAKMPFAKVALVIFLEPRDLPWWPLSRLRGRRDTLIVRGVFGKILSVELEAIDPGSWSGRDALPRVPREWPVRDVDGLKVFGEEKRAAALLELCARAGLTVRRLSVRRTEPHFQIHVDLPDMQRPARELFETIHSLAAAILK
jgi:hypothetical protein